MIHTKITHGTSRAVELFKDCVYKYPKSEEGKYCNDSEIYIWEKTKHRWLCSCKKKDDWHIEMERVYYDVSMGRSVPHCERDKLNLPNGFWILIKLHPNLEFGIDEEGNPKIYDYADAVFDWDLEHPEDKFIEDLITLSAI